jgi:aryl-alcohol dehydrogenase-like predicted oxidoreductase
MLDEHNGLSPLPWHRNVRQQTDEAESFRVFDKATDAGVNFIDTADVYPRDAVVNSP